MLASPRSLVRLLLALFAIHLSACGSDAAKPSASRVARQDMRDATGALTQYWLYAYDASGQGATIQGFSSSGALLNVTTATWVGGLRSQAAVTNPVGALISTTTYDYVGGALDRATTTYLSGIGDNYTTYLFANGRKLTSHRYLKDGTLQYWNEFSYDAASGRRLGRTSHDAAGAVTSTSTRTYTNGQLASALILDGAGAVTSTMSFTYEAGPLAFDYDVLLEF
jgi:hypothetical protein